MSLEFSIIFILVFFSYETQKSSKYNKRMLMNYVVQYNNKKGREMFIMIYLINLLIICEDMSGTIGLL